MIDNLLTTDSPLHHNGKVCIKNEVLTPSMERWIVLHWLYLLHPGLPDLVTRTFSHQLQSKTLKDIKPQVSKSLNALLSELRESDIHTQVNRVNFKFNRSKKRQFHSKSSQSKWCRQCKLFDKPYEHDIVDCPQFTLAEKKRLARAFQIDVVSDEEETADDYTQENE